MSQPEPQPERPETGSDVGQVLRGSEAPRLDASQLWVSKVEGSIRASENRYLFSSRTSSSRVPHLAKPVNRLRVFAASSRYLLACSDPAKGPVQRGPRWRRRRARPV